MGRQTRIPGLIDVIVVDDLDAIERLDELPAVDRGFWPAGPLINRILKARFNRDAVVRGQQMPAFLSRDYVSRPEARRELFERLDAIPVDVIEADPDVKAIAAFVNGSTDIAIDRVAPRVQGVVCRLFRPDFESNLESWHAAERLQRYLEALPLLAFRHRVFGRLEQAIETLDASVNSDIDGVHAAGIAVHSMVKSIEKMREIRRHPVRRYAVDADTIAFQCLEAPRRIPRTVTERVRIPERRRPVTPRVLILYDFARAAESRATTGQVFKADSWSACPARGFVPRFLATIWRLAEAQ